MNPGGIRDAFQAKFDDALETEDRVRSIAGNTQIAKHLKEN